MDWMKTSIGVILQWDSTTKVDFILQILHNDSFLTEISNNNIILVIIMAVIYFMSFLSSH